MRYNAFISYRHGELDMAIAKKVHKKLETFKIPHNIKKQTGKKKIERVFRDQEELLIGSNLSDNIEEAIAESEFLIVICSPRTPGSEWVQKEISTFIRLHDRKHILAVLIEGEPEESFPAILVTDEWGNNVEPLAADVRGATAAKRNKKMKTEIVRLAASILGCNYDDLRQRHKERRMHRMMGIIAMVAALGIGFGVYSSYKTMQVNSNLRAKLENQSKNLASTSLEVYNTGNRKAAALIAMEALPTGKNSNRPFVTQAQYALTTALNAYHTGDINNKDGVLTQELPVSGMQISCDAKSLISYDSLGNVYVWDLTTNTLRYTIASKANENTVGYLQYVCKVGMYEDTAVVVRNYEICGYDIDGNEIFNIPSEEKISNVVFSEDFSTVFCNGSSTYEYVDIADGKLVVSGKTGDDDAIYTTCAAIMENGERACIPLSSMSQVESLNKVEIINLSSGARKIYNMPVYSVYAMTTWQNRYLLMVGSMNTDISLDSQEYHLCCMDIKSGRTIWDMPLDISCTIYDSGDCILKCHEYTNAYGNTEDDAIVTISNNVFAVDISSGDLVNYMTSSNSIVSLQTGETSSLVRLGLNNGTVSILDTATATFYSDYAIDTGMDEMSVMQSAEQTMVFSSINDSSILIMRYTKDENAVEVASTSGELLEAASSDGKYYAVFDNSYLLSIIDPKNDKLIGTVDLSEYSDTYVSKMCFNSGDILCITEADSEAVVYIDCKKLEEERVDYSKKVSFEGVSVEPVFSANGDYIVMTGSHRAIVIDTGTRDIMYSSDAIAGYNAQGFAISPNGNYLLFSDLETGNVYKVDLKKNKAVNLGTYAISSNKLNHTLTFSEDEAYVALGCADGMVRVVDIQTLEVTYEIAAATGVDSFLAFSPNNRRLFIQKSDGYYSVYDLKHNDYVYISTENAKSFNSICWNENDTITLINEDGLMVFDLEYEKLLYAPNGKVYIPEAGKIYSYCDLTDTVLAFPYYSLEDLIDKEKKEFPGAELSKWERIKYNID